MLTPHGVGRFWTPAEQSLFKQATSRPPSKMRHFRHNSGIGLSYDWIENQHHRPTIKWRMDFFVYNTWFDEMAKGEADSELPIPQ